MEHNIIKFFLLVLVLGIGLPSCGPKKEKKGDLKEAKAKVSRDQRAQIGSFEDDLDEFELIDEMDDDFFDEPASGMQTDKSDDFAWADDDKVRLREVLFDFNKDAIRADQMPSISKAVAHAKDVTRRGNYFVVEGHADAIGKNRIYNLHLSERRAHAVADRLIGSGVTKDRIKVVGRGQEMLKIITDLVPEAQAPNRRVEFYEIAV